MAPASSSKDLNISNALALSHVILAFKWNGEILCFVSCRIVVNTELSGIQLRNLQAAWGLPVLDRIGLIIEIFDQRARTREAKLQVCLLSLQSKRLAHGQRQ